jgi:hypothetical protein
MVKNIFKLVLLILSNMYNKLKIIYLQRLSIRCFLNISSGFLPVAINFLRRVPVLGILLKMPIISRILDMLAGDTNRTRV